MPIRKTLFNGGIYHVIVRGVADMSIFKNDQDRFRMVFSLYEFNNDRPVAMKDVRKKRRDAQKGSIEKSRGRVSGNLERRDPFVEILAFCFMPNHIHLLLKQVKDNGITRFMRKLGTGYAGYFNKKHERKGYLFQGRFKSINIQNDNQLRVVFSYIHTNPVSLIKHSWKENGIADLSKTIKFLENYKWSSYLDYIGKENFPSVSLRNSLLEALGGVKGCKKFIDDWLKHKKLAKY